ncbi:MAG: 50S ribosomal protein L4 [bacterium]
MSKLSVYDMKGKLLETTDISDELLTSRGQQAVHDVIVAYQAGIRAGTASTLGKGAVAGSNKKPWKQKGTGRARAGFRQSPVWRGGGVAHGPHPRSYEKKVSIKVARLAFRRAFSDLVREERIRVLDQFAVTEAKTKAVADVLKSLGLKKGALIIVDKVDKNLICSLRNIPNVEAVTAQDVSTFQLIRFPVTLIKRAALDGLRTRLAVGSGRKS